MSKVSLQNKKKRTQSSKVWLLRQMNDQYVAKAKEQGYRSRAAFKLLEINEKFKLLKRKQTVIDLGCAPGGWLQVVSKVSGVDGKIVGGGNGNSWIDGKAIVGDGRAAIAGSGNVSNDAGRAIVGDSRAVSDNVSSSNDRAIVDDSKMVGGCGNNVNDGSGKATNVGGKVIGVDLKEVAPISGVTLLTGDFTDSVVVDKILLELGNRKADLILSDMAPSACGIPSVDCERIVFLVRSCLQFCFLALRNGGSFVAKVLRGGTEAMLLCEVRRAFTDVCYFKPASSRTESAEMYLVARGFHL
jgi:cell division protein FtsJ